MRKYLSLFAEAILVPRGWRLAVDFGAAALLIGTALLDRTTWAAAFDFVLAGFLLACGTHALLVPGVLRKWAQIEQMSINAQMGEAIGEAIHRQMAQHEDDEPPRKPN